MYFSQGSSSMSSGSAASKSLRLAIVEALIEELASQFSPCPPSSPVRLLRRSVFSARTTAPSALAHFSQSFAVHSHMTASWLGLQYIGSQQQSKRTVVHYHCCAVVFRMDTHKSLVLEIAQSPGRCTLLLGGLCFCDFWFLPSLDSMCVLSRNPEDSFWVLDSRG